MQKILDVTGQRPMSGSGPILLIDGNNVELTCGLVSFGNYYNGEIHEEFEEINLRLWRSLLERVIKQGAQFYMMGDFNSRVMAEMGAYPVEFYNLMKSIKQTIDPKYILSRGKYNFWGEKSKS
jgi:FAD/FMN-containing dehydrogenase